MTPTMCSPFKARKLSICPYIEHRCAIHGTSERLESILASLPPI